MSYQKVIVVGNIGNDPETVKFEGGGQVTNVNLATSERWNDQQGNKQERTEWFRCVLNGKLSETVEKYVSKGDKVLFEGKIKTRKYVNAEQVECSVSELIVLSMEFLTPKKSDQ